MDPLCRIKYYLPNITEIKQNMDMDYGISPYLRVEVEEPMFILHRQLMRKHSRIMPPNQNE